MNKPNNLSYSERAVCSVDVTIKSIDNFYEIVKWLNSHIGQGKNQWTMEGRIRKKLERGDVVNTRIHIFRPDFDVDDVLVFILSM